MADNDVNSTLVLDGDASGADKALTSVNKKFNELQQNKALDTLAKKAAEFAARTGNTQTALIKLQGELAKIGASEKDIDKVARAFDKGLVQAQKKAEQGAKEAEKALARQRMEQERLNDSFEQFDRLNSQTRRRSGAFGDVDTSIGAVRGLVDTASPGAGTGLTALQDIFAAKEAIDNLGPPLKYLKENAATAAPGLLALGGGAIAIAALSAAFALLTQRMNEAREASRKAAETTIEGLNAEQEARFLAERQRFEELQQRIDAERQASIVGANSLNSYREEIDRLNEVFKNFNAEGADAGFSNRQQVVDEIGRIREEMDGLAETTSEAQTRLKSLTDVQNEYSAAIKDAERLKNLAAAELELQTVRDQHGATIAQLKQQEDELNAAYKASAAAREAARNLSDSREREDRDRATSRAAEDLQRALEAQAEAHQKNLENITKRGSDAIADAYKALADRQQQASKAIADVQAQYQKESLKAEYEFNKERSRAQRDFLKEQKRAFEDFKKSQAASILDNDVLSFLEGQDAFKTDRRRSREDRRDQRSDNRQDFDDEQRERLAAAQERIAEIQAELAEFQAATALKIAAIKEQTRIDLAEAQRVYEEKLAKDAALREIQAQRDQEDLQLRQKRRDQDRQIEDAAAQTALQSSLERIAMQETAQNDALDAAIAKAAQFKSVVESIQLPTGVAPTPGNPVPQIPAYGGYIPTPGSEQFYEDPGQGPAGQSGGGGFGTGFSGVSSVGSGGRRGGSGLTINVQPRVMEMSGLEFVLKEDFDALIETIKDTWREKEVNLS